MNKSKSVFTMKKIILSVFFLLSVLNVKSYSQLTQLWVKQYIPSTNYNQDAFDSYVDSAGNVYVAGTNGAGYSQNDIITLKYNSSGEYQWTKSVNNNSVAYSQDRGKFISGYRNNGKQYIYTAAEINYSGYTFFIWLLKYDENGNEIYRRGYATAPFGLSHNLQNMNCDQFGNVTIVGGNGSQIILARYDTTLTNIFSVQFSNPSGYHTGIGYDYKINSAGETYVIGDIWETAANSRKMVLLKYSSGGGLMFSKILGYISDHQPQYSRISIGQSGNVYVSAKSNYNYCMVKFNSSGDTLWKRIYNGSSNSLDFCNASVLDANENFYVTGIVNGQYGDIGTVKYDSSGNLQWVKTQAGDDGWADEGKDIMVDASGNIVVTGYIDNSVGQKFVTLKYNPAGNLLWMTKYDFAVTDYEGALVVNKDLNDNIIAVGNCGYVTISDFATIKYNSSGNILWKRKYNASQISTNAINSIANDKNENVYAVGRFRNGQFGDDILLMKYNSAGVKKWEWLRGGINGEDMEDAGNAVCTDKNGFVYFTGTMHISLAAQKRDIYTMKLDSNGNRIWNVFTANYGGNYNEEGVEIGTDSAGNVYVGYNAEAVSATNFGVLKYNPSGTVMWNYAFNGPANDTDKMTDMRVDKAGYVYVTGNTKTVSNGFDIVSIKLNPTGIPVWLTSCNGSANSNDESRSIDFDKNGNTYITGTVKNTGTGSDLAAIKYFSNGTLGWTYVKSNQDSVRKESGVCIKYDSLNSQILLFGDLNAAFPYNTLGVYQCTLDSSGSELYASILNPSPPGSYVIGGTSDGSGQLVCNTMRGTANTGYDARLYRQNFEFNDFNGSSSGNEIPAFNESIASNLNSLYSGLNSFDSTFGPVMTIIKYKAPAYYLNLEMWIQGFVYDNSFNHYMYPDTVSVSLRSPVPPYNVVDSKKWICSFEGTFYKLHFDNITGSNQYYVVVNHRNSIETWSATPITISPGFTDCNFKNIANVYGNNLALLPGPTAYGIYSGDVNQNGSVDAQDLSLIDNDAFNFASGYINSDVTGNNVTDAADLAIVDNNAFNFVSRVRP